MKELFSALSKAQAAMDKASKDKTNPAFRSKYADLESCIDAVRPALESNGLAFVQVSHDAEKAACIETVILHSSGEQFSCGKISVPVTKADAHGFGSALTYARRYSLSSAFGLATEDDDGNQAAKAKPAAKPALPPAMPEGQGLPNSNAKSLVSAETLEHLTFVAAHLHELVETESDVAIYELYTSITDSDQKAALWSMLDSKDRSYIKKTCAALRAEDEKVIK